MKYSNQNGTIDILVEKEKEKIYISIQDYGIGIDQEKQDFIFQAYKQIDQGDIKPLTKKGFGLGLYITNKLIELLNGTIKLKSPGKNRGTIVQLTIPVEK